MAMIIVHEKARAAIPVAEVERLRGYNQCANGTQALLFVAGLLPYLMTFVDNRIEEDSTLEQILKWAVKGEQSRGGHKCHSIHAVQVEENKPPRERAWAAEMTEIESRYKNLLSVEIAGVKASYKDTGAKPKAKPTTRGSRGRGNSSNRGGGARGDLPPLPPMAQRDKWIYCSCCLQWGRHVTRECGYTKDMARKEFTPMDKSVRPGTTARDNQFLCYRGGRCAATRRRTRLETRKGASNTENQVILL
jgi:hypothetical protein